MRPVPVPSRLVELAPLAFLALATAAAHGQGTSGRLVDPSLGFAMTLAPGWLAGQREAVHLVGHMTQPGFLAVAHYPGTFSRPDLLGAPAQGFHDESLQVAAIQPLVQRHFPAGAGEGLYYQVQGTMGGSPVRGWLGWFLGPTGQAVLVTALAAPADFPGFDAPARAMLDSVEIAAPVAAGAVAEWKRLLAGKKLTHLWSYSSSSFGGGYAGGSSEQYWHLCADGRYWATSRSSMAIDASGGGASGSAHGQGREVGRWDVVGTADAAALLLTDSKGGVERLPLSIERGLKYMGGKKFFVTEDVVCP